MRKIFSQRSFHIFSGVFTAFFLILTSISTVQSYQGGKEEEIQYIRSIETDSQHVKSYLNQNLTAVVNTCNSIFTSRWFEHYCNNAQIYQSEFHMLRRMEIMSDIQSKVNALPFVSDILVITSYPDNVIHRCGWSTIAEYLNIYDEMSIIRPTGQSDVFTVRNVDSQTCSILFPDNIPSRRKGVVCALIDRKSFSTALNNVLPNNAIYVQAMLDGQLLYETGEQAEDSVLIKRSISVPEFSLTIGYSNYRDTSMAKARVLSYILMELAVIAISLIASGLITFLTLKPFNQLIRRFGGGNTHPLSDPYRPLSDCFESFSHRNAQLYDEKESLSQSMNHFLTLMDKEVLFRMLTDPDFDFQDENILSSIPCIIKGCPFVLILLDSKVQDECSAPDPDWFRPVSEYGQYYYTFNVFPNNLCLMIWFGNNEAAHAEYTELYAQAADLSKDRFYFSVSGILQDPEEMSRAYLSLRAELSRQKQEHFDVPISMEIKLIQDLQVNNTEDLTDTLEQAKAQYDPDAFLWLLLRIANDYGMDASDLKNQYSKDSQNHSYEKQWDFVIQFAEHLCHSISLYKTGMHKSIAVIQRYIDENYCNPDLSVNQLADHLSIHRTLISKMMKSQLGTTFSDYVLGLRIHKAMRLLKETDSSIQEIGIKVGYLNYTTFKRAFIRYLGVSPREYREQEYQSGRRLPIV